jgi:hypothetical protein
MLINKKIKIISFIILNSIFAKKIHIFIQNMIPTHFINKTNISLSFSLF